MRGTHIQRRTALLIAGALTAGFFLRLWFIIHAAVVAGDTLIYGDIAKSWLDYGVYGFTRSVGPPRPTLIRLPGYPLFLAFCFSIFGREHYTAVMYVQMALDLLTCLVLAALAGRLFGRRAGLAALWLAALCPFTAGYVAAPLAEIPTLTCIAIAFYALYRWQQTIEVRPFAPYNHWLFLLAAALSYCILLRPEQGLLAAAILPVMFWTLRSKPPVPSAPVVSRFIPIFLTAVLVILPLFPWAFRNWKTFHVFQPLAPHYATDPGEAIPLGFQRWYRTWGVDFASTENVYWNYIGAPIEISDLPLRAFDNDSQYGRTAAVLSDYNRTMIATPTLDRRFGVLASERIHDDPFRYYITLPAARLINMTFRPRTEMLPIQLEWWRFQHPGQSIFAIVYSGLNLTYFVLAGIGIYRWRRKTLNPQIHPEPENILPAISWMLAWAMIAFVILRSALLLTLDNSEPRYTLEFFPVLIVCASIVFASDTPGNGLSSQ